MDTFRGRALAALIAVGVSPLACFDGKDTRPPVWSYVSAVIVQPNCATSSCHDQATAASGLDLSSPDNGYVSLTRPSRSLVVPFDPAQSRLTQLLRGEAKPKMPPDRWLPGADADLIDSWILRGATDDRAGAQPQ